MIPRRRRMRLADALDLCGKLTGDAREAWLATLAQSDPTLSQEVRRLVPFADEHRRSGTPTLVGLFATASPTDEIGRVVGGRWKLVGLLGVGGAGAVYRAQDVETGRSAALKLVHGLSQARQLAMRRESAFLRWARLPGVARLIDDGADGDSVFCVTELVEGAHFPGDGRGRSWDALQPVVVRLLGTVGAMHATGVVHRDLKPANVLVDAAGTPVVIDLGISSEIGQDAGRRDTSGTPAYAAPEQLGRGRSDARSDLFAIGVMIVEALTGRRPQPGARGAASLAPSDLPVPPRVLRLLRSMLSAAPSGRPRSAWEALDRLQPPPRVRRGPRWSEADLRDRFHGPDRILHLREDAAAEVFRRTGGVRADVERVLRHWVQSGFAWDDGGRLRVTVVSLERLRTLTAADPASRSADPLDRDLATALRAGDDAAIVRAAVRAARKRMRVGRLDAAFAAAFEGAVAARRMRRTRREERVLELACLAALRAGDLVGISRAILLLQRATADSDDVRDLEVVMRAAERPAARDSLAALRRVCRASRSAGVLRVAWSVRNVGARMLGLDEDRRNVRALERWLRSARPPGAASIAATAKGYVRYREARFGESVRLHRLAARSTSDPYARARCLVDAAGSAAEGGFPEARRLALRAMDRATTLRSPSLEIQAVAALRHADASAGRAVVPDAELVQIAASLRSNFTSALAFVEAGVAWRRGDREAVRRLTEIAVGAWGASPLTMAARALAAAAGAPLSLADARTIAAEAGTKLPTLVAAQTLALLAVAHPPLTPSLRRRFRDLRLPDDARNSDRIREVISMDETRGILGIPRPSCRRNA